MRMRMVEKKVMWTGYSNCAMSLSRRFIQTRPRITLQSATKHPPTLPHTHPHLDIRPLCHTLIHTWMSALCATSEAPWFSTAWARVRSVDCASSWEPWMGGEDGSGDAGNGKRNWES